MNTFEMNNARKDVEVNPQIKRNSPVVEVFSAMCEGKTLPNLGPTTDKAVEYIKELASKAGNGDTNAASELNQIRREILNPAVLEEAKLLELFGNYQALAYDESIEREVWGYAGGGARIQALDGTVTYPRQVVTRYSVPTVDISSGYEIDYRAMSMGNMERENYGMQLVRTDIMNKAAAYVVKKVYQSIKNATGVKYFAEAAGIAQASLDNVVAKIRRFGPTSIVGAYAVVSQINNFVPYTNNAVSSPITGISDAVMEEIRKNGLVMNYKGSLVREIPTGYDYTKVNAAGTDFDPILPEGLLYVLPIGLRSPVATWTRGGLTSFTGNDVSTGRILTRFDLTIAADVAQGHEYEIGLMNDTNISSVASMAL